MTQQVEFGFYRCITDLPLVTNYTIWWQRNMCVSELPRALLDKAVGYCGWDSNPWPPDHEADALPHSYQPSHPSFRNAGGRMRRVQHISTVALPIFTAPHWYWYLNKIRCFSRSSSREESEEIVGHASVIHTTFHTVKTTSTSATFRAYRYSFSANSYRHEYSIHLV